MNSKTNSVSASIVTYNSEKDIRKVLDSLRECKVDKIFVIDNCSTDSTVKIISEQYPEVELICMDRNVGYGAANNIAIKKTTSVFHIILNPDITLSKDNLDAMINYMTSNEDVAILTPRVLNHDGTEQFLPRKNPKFKYLISGRFENVSYFRKLRDDYTLRGKNLENPIEVDLCTGCFMFTRTEMLQKSGGFDERYFMYLEDADLTRTIKKYGKTMYVPTVTVNHEWKRESSKSIKMLSIHIISMIKYSMKWAGKK